MKASDPKGTREPIGIVIAGLPTPPAATVFAAFEWGPAPAAADEPAPERI